MAKEFTHLDERDNPRMVNVGEKPVTERLARAKREEEGRQKAA